MCLMFTVVNNFDLLFYSCSLQEFLPGVTGAMSSLRTIIVVLIFFTLFTGKRLNFIIAILILGKLKPSRRSPRKEKRLMINKYIDTFGFQKKTLN